MIKALACLYRYGPLVILIPLMLQHYAVAGMLILFFIDIFKLFFELLLNALQFLK